MRQNNQEPEESGSPAPPGLISALQQLPQERLFIPPTLDEALLRAARLHLTRPERKGWRWIALLRWALAAGAAAVVLAIAIWIWPVKETPIQGASRAGDLNHDGRVDILDALVLAREIQARQTGNVSPTADHASSLRDVNRDGSIDAQDVASLAAQAVKLDKGGKS